MDENKTYAEVLKDVAKENIKLKEIIKKMMPTYCAEGCAMSKFIELTDWQGKFKRLVNVDEIKYISEEYNPVQVIMSVYSIDERDIEHEGGFACKESYEEIKEMILNG